MIKVINFKYQGEIGDIINTTSRSDNWSKGLSPFFCGPVDLYKNYKSINVENAWQYSKVYGHLDHTDDKGDPTTSYFKWAEAGWSKIHADRYPMGKGIRPEYSYWDGDKLSYIEARKKIYIPLYSQAVQKTFAYKHLKQEYSKFGTNETLYLLDFDAHNLDPTTIDYEKLWNNDQIKVGHAYVLAMLLEGIIT